MTPIFADTYFFLATINRNDSAHDVAISWASKNPRLVTSEWVLLEIADGLCGGRGRLIALQLIESIRTNRRVRVVSLSSRLLWDALALYASRPDKEWSLTDCTSFLIMRRHGLEDVLTADHHFAQAGFSALLRPAR